MTTKRETFICSFFGQGVRAERVFGGRLWGMGGYLLRIFWGAGFWRVDCAGGPSFVGVLAEAVTALTHHEQVLTEANRDEKREGGEGGERKRVRAMESEREREMKSEMEVVTGEVVTGKDCPVFAGFEEGLAFWTRVLGLNFLLQKAFHCLAGTEEVLAEPGFWGFYLERL